MFRGLGVTLACASCGRIAFAPLGGDGGDGDSTVTMATCAPQLVGPTSLSVPGVGHAWSGSEHLVAWGDGVGLQTRRVDGDGVPLRDAVIASPVVSVFSEPISVAWSGAEWSVTWNTDANFFSFASVGSDGIPSGIVVDHATTDDPSGVRAALSPTGYGVAWNEDIAGPSTEIMIAALDGSGTRTAPINLVSGGGSPFRASPAIVWDGNQFDVVWGEEMSGNLERIMFRQATSAAVPQGTPLEVARYPAGSLPTMPKVSLAAASTLSQLGIVWSDAVVTHIMRIDFAGAVLADTTLQTESRGRAIAWNGNTWGVAWSDHAGKLFFEELDSSGALVGDVLLVASGSEGPVSLVDAGGYTVTYVSSDAVYFVRICR